MKNDEVDVIDFVILWVDGNDKKWIEEKKNYQVSDNKSSCGDNRYRDWGLLKYWFRSIERFAPWVNKIHFVTWGHIPDWLDTSNAKLNIVKHEDFIPHEYLPTFNSNVIQYYLDKIPGISERFVMFDDDMYVLDKIKPADFFVGDKICDVYSEKPIFIGKKGDRYPHCLLNNMQIINQKYRKISFFKKNIFKYFNIKYGFFVNLRNLYFLPIRQFLGIYSQHICQAYTKKHYQLFRDYCGEELNLVSKNRFRESTDFSTFLVRYIELLEGDFVPRSLSFGKKYELSPKNNEKVYNAIKKQKYKVLCINDSSMDYDFNHEKNTLTELFDEVFPDKSSFEL